MGVIRIEQAMFLPMWKAPVTVNMMVEKNEKRYVKYLSLAVKERG